MIISPFAAVVNNLFATNTAVGFAYFGAGISSGGGLYPDLNGGIISNNTFADNIAAGTVSGGAPPPGGMESVLVTNNIVAFNSGSLLTRQSWTRFRHNLVFGNTGYEPPGPSPLGTDGNISADPLFADAAGGDYRLSPLSPAIDAGDNNAAFSAVDMDGSPRLQGVAVDIGAYEWTPGGPLTMADGGAALRIAAGLSAAMPDLTARLNVEAPGTTGIDIRDAVALLTEAVR